MTSRFGDNAFETGTTTPEEFAPFAYITIGSRLGSKTFQNGWLWSRLARIGSVVSVKSWAHVEDRLTS